MATLPTPEESARVILAIFKKHNARPDFVLGSGPVNLQFLTAGGTAAEYLEGIKYADEQGWLEAGPNNGFKLTKAGFDAM